MSPSTDPVPARLWVIVPLFGVGQIITWGSLFYAIAVLAGPMAESLGMTTSTVFGAFSLSLGVSGLVSPAVGRAIDRLGGSIVLAAGSLVSALALAVIALAGHPLVFFGGWMLAGIAMAANLYDAAFPALSQFTGSRYRPALTALTLFGGLASTVFWPLAWHLNESLGWRPTIGLFALLHLLICLPIHRFALPRTRVPAPATPPASTAGPVPSSGRRRRFLRLAAAFTISSFVISATAVHAIGALRASGLEGATAILAASLIGPMQVVGRILELAVARGVAATRVGIAVFTGMLLAMLLLWQVGLAPWLAFAFATLYGLSNGVMSIVRGTVPAELFGRNDYGRMMGHLAQPAFFAKAIAPVLVAVLVADAGRYPTMALLLAVLAGAALAAYAAAVRGATR